MVNCLFKASKNPPPSGLFRGSAVLIIVILSAAILSFLVVSLSRFHSATVSSFTSSSIASQAKQYAESRMEQLVFDGYGELVVIPKRSIPDTLFFESIDVSVPQQVENNLFQKNVVVNIFHEGDTIPRYRLERLFYSNDSSQYVVNENNYTNKLSMKWEDDRMVTSVDGADQRKLLTDVTVDCSNTNLNNLVETGFFNGKNLVNAPKNGTDWFYIENIRHHNLSNYYINQRATDFFTGKTFQRQCRAGVWTAWEEWGGSSGILGTAVTLGSTRSGTAAEDGFLLAGGSSKHSAMNVKVNGVTLGYVVNRDYGTGTISACVPVSKGSKWEIFGTCNWAYWVPMK